MTHLSVSEWGKVPVGSEGGFSVSQAEALVETARRHPLGGEEGLGILADHRHHLRARQMVGVVAASGCSLEILPKVDPDAPSADASTVRQQLVSLIDLALGLNLGHGAATTMAREASSLLDILIRIFAERLLAETRRGLPRLYLQCEEDLPALRGRLDVARQFTANAVRPDRLSCRFDVLDHNTPLMQIMAAAVVFLRLHAREQATIRLLDELRFVFADVDQRSIVNLPWDRVRIDRTNRRWESLFALAKLLIGRDWQGTSQDAQSREGITLLFPMEKLFEKAVATLLRRSLAGSGMEVLTQQNQIACLGDWTGGEICNGQYFGAKPDILVKRGQEIVAVIDTKWKRLGSSPLDKDKGIKQSDIYQMMAYSRLYRCDRLMLLYPAVPGVTQHKPYKFGIHGSRQMLAVGQIDVATDQSSAIVALASLIKSLMPS